MSEELKQQLQRVSSQIQNLNNTRAACAQMIQDQKIKLVDEGQEIQEGEDPLSISLSGQMVNQLLTPFIQSLNTFREQLIDMKEQILNQMDGDESTEQVEAPKNDSKKSK